MTVKYLLQNSKWRQENTEIRNRLVFLYARWLIHDKDARTPHSKEIAVLIMLLEQVPMYMHNAILLYTSIMWKYELKWILDLLSLNQWNGLAKNYNCREFYILNSKKYFLALSWKGYYVKNKYISWTFLMLKRCFRVMTVI